MAVRAVIGLVLLAMAVYAGDWLVWRVLRGGATGVVAVSREAVAPLKVAARSTTLTDWLKSLAAGQRCPKV